jgi:hypothetical protein
MSERTLAPQVVLLDTLNRSPDARHDGQSLPERQPIGAGRPRLRAFALLAFLGYLTIRVYRDHPPVPGRIATEIGQTIIRADDILVVILGSLLSLRRTNAR